MPTHDLAVVGLGLIGSAALRHASESASVIIGIGPAEPNDWPNHAGPFASHYDSGRITRRIDAKPQWAILASRAIEQYGRLEASTGVRFHTPSGIVFVRNDQAGIDRLTSVAAELAIPIEVGPVGTTISDLPMLALPDSYTVVREGAPAGAIDPRRMRQAQIEVAQMQGAKIVTDVATAVSQTAAGFEVRTANGQSVEAARVVVAAGAYSGDLLPDRPAVAVRPEAVVLGEVTEADAESLSLLPSVLYLLDNPELDDVYIVPAAQYPDGRWYVKIGGSQRQAPLLETTEAMNRSMRSGQAGDQIQAMQNVLQEVLPDVDFVGWQAKPCLITDTASGLPYIDRLDSGLVVAFGGNGHSAKSSDAIGALGAGLALNERWTDEELDASDFAVRFGDYRPSDGSRHGN